MSYIHLTIEERTSIAHLYRQGVSLRQTAETIVRNVSTIKREIEGNYTSFYNERFNYYPQTS